METNGTKIKIDSLSVYDILEYFDDHLWQLEKNLGSRKAAESSMIDCMGDFGEIPANVEKILTDLELSSAAYYAAISRILFLAHRVHFGHYSSFCIDLAFYKGR